MSEHAKTSDLAAAPSEAYEPILRHSADYEIVTTAPVAEVVATLERVAAAARSSD